MGAAVHIGGNVARADTEGRFALAVSGLDHAGTAGGQDHRGGVVAHQLGGALDRRVLQAGDQPRRHARPLAGLPDHPHRLGGALRRRRVGGDDDRVAGLDRDQRLEDRRRGRVRGGSQRDDHTDGSADFDDLAFLVVLQHPAGGGVLDVLPHVAGRELVFQFLVQRETETGFLVGELPEPGGLGDRGLNHRLTDPVDLLLGGELEAAHRLAGLVTQVAGLLDGCQILVDVCH